MSDCEGCFNFIDDILVYGSSIEEHDRHLEKVLEKLAEHNVGLNESKCKFRVSTIDFLGHRLSEKGIEPATDKMLAIKSFRPPETTDELSGFLGLVNWVGKFIPGLATLAYPLRTLTRKGAPFEWREEQSAAFEEIKQQLSNSKILGYFDPKDKSRIYVDASPVGLGAVLVQHNEKTGPRIIMYAHKSLSKAEMRYSQTEKEALALVWGPERFHHLVYGREFELITDHKAHEFIFSPKSKPCARIERWVLRMQAYKYKVIYRPGKENIADPLSRLSCASPTEESLVSLVAEQYVNWVVTTAEPQAIKIAEILEESTKDPAIQSVKKALNLGEWSELALPFRAFESELCFQGDILLRGSRIVMPISLQERALDLGHEGHPGISVMKRRLRAKLWWPKMDSQIEASVKKCFGCTIVSAPDAPEPMRRTELPSQPWQHLAMDFLGPLPSGHYLFVVIDYFSRFKEVEIMTKIDSNETIDRLETMFARFGLPMSVTADNGRQFISREIKDFFEKHNIRLISTTPFWPQQNGEVERQNRSLLKRLKISQNTKSDWKTDLKKYLLMYRSTPHSTTLRSPADLMFRYQIRDKLPTMNQPLEAEEELRERDKNEKEKGKEYADGKRGARPSVIAVGDVVLAKRQIVSNKLQSGFETTPYKVICLKEALIISLIFY